MNGFEEDIKTKILGTQSHIVISTYQGGIARPDDLERKIMQDPGVIGAAPFILSQGLISAPGGISGVVIRGIEPASAEKVIRLKEIITQGSSQNLNESGILLGSELALRSGVSVGDAVTVISPTGSMTPLGMIPKSMSFIVCLLYTSDAADDLLCVDLGGRRIIKKKNTARLTHTPTQ